MRNPAWEAGRASQAVGAARRGRVLIPNGKCPIHGRPQGPHSSQHRSRPNGPAKNLPARAPGPTRPQPSPKKPTIEEHQAGVVNGYNPRYLV